MAVSNLNKVFLIGNLTRDSELKENGNLNILNFSIAVNESRKSGDQYVSEANYFECTLFGIRAKSLEQFLKKGKKIGVLGKLHQDRWEKDGQKYSKVSVIVDEIELLGGNENNSESKGIFSNANNNDEKVPF